MIKRYIGIISDNSIDMIHLIVDVWNSDDCVVIIDWRQPLCFIREAVLLSKISTCYLDKINYLKMAEALREICSVKLIEGDSQRNRLEYPAEWLSSFVDRYTTDDALILFSSGTTGKAKGIVLSHYAINTNADAIIQRLNLTKTDILGIIKPLTHSSTIVGEMLVALKTKQTFIVCPLVYSMRSLVRILAQYKVNIIFVNPFLLDMLTNTAPIHEMNALKKIYVSGEMLSQCLLMKVRFRFPYMAVYNMYGLTEAGPRVTMQDQMNPTDISVGRCIHGVSVEIRNDYGHVLGPYSTGSIFVNTPSRFTRIIGEKDNRENKGDFFETGDVGYWDKEKNLHIVGRQDTMLVIRAHNIYPESLEERLLYGCPYVKECMILKDEKTNGLICHFIAMSVDMDESEIKRKIYRFCLENFASYEIPSNFIQVEALPRNHNGKKLRKLSSKISDGREG